MPDSKMTQPYTMFSCFSQDQLEEMFLARNWAKLDESERLDLLQEVANRECSNLGDKFVCHVSFDDLPHETSGVQYGANNIRLSRENFVFDKMYSEYNGRPVMQTLNDSNFRAYETIQHEFQHVYQNMVTNGVIEADDRTRMVYESNGYTVTELYGFPASQYMQGHTSNKLYYLNPTELDAYKTSQDKTNILKASLREKYGTDLSMIEYENTIEKGGYEAELQRCRNYFKDPNIDKTVETILVCKYNGIPCNNVDKKLELMVEKEMLITQDYIDHPEKYEGDGKKMSEINDWKDLHVSREEYDSQLRDSVNAFYEHQMNDPSVSQEEAISTTAEMAENYQISMEEFDAQAAEAAQSPQVDNDGAVYNGTGNNTGGVNNDSGTINARNPENSSTDPKTGNVTYKGSLSIMKGDHTHMPARTDAYLSNDERGHVNASSLGGINTRDNVVPQNRDVNHGSFMSMEKGECNALNSGATINSEKTAYVNGEPGSRPSAFIINDEITYADGHTETVSLSFTNESYSDQDQWNIEAAALSDTFDAPNPMDGLRDSMNEQSYSSLMEETDAYLPNIEDEYEATEIAENYQVSMEEFDTQASEVAQSQQMDNDESVDNGADNDTGGMDNDGGIDVE